MPKDKVREDRIQNEIIVDCYGSDEIVLGWYYHLTDLLSFPFKARCIAERTISPLKKGEIVEVVDIADHDDCSREMFVIIRFMDRLSGVPLMQLEPMDVDDATAQAVGDWHYWMAQGYQL